PMGRRRKNPVSKPSSEIYDAGYSCQQGEFYPEHHQTNIQKLRERFPEYSATEIEGIYRQACRLDYDIQQWSGGATLSERQKEERLVWLEDHYYGFSRKSLLQALERTETKLLPSPNAI